MAGSGDIRAGRAYVELFTEDSKYIRGLRKAEAALRQFGQRAQAIGRKMVMVSAAIGGGLLWAAKGFANFDDAMRKVQARSRGTAEDLAALNKQAKELGRSTVFTAVQIAELMAILGRRGFRRTEVFQQTPGIVAFARAAGEGKDLFGDLEVAAEVATGALQSWGMQASDMPEIADLMTVAVNNSALSLEALRESLSYIGPLAADAGYDLKNMLQVLGELANVNIRGSMAGTALRRMIQKLVKDVEGLSGATIDIDAPGGNMRQIPAIIADIVKATEDLTKPQRLAVFEDIFGLRGISAAAGLSRQSEKSKQLADALDNFGGEAKRVSTIMDAGLGGAMRRLWSAFEGIRIAIGEAFGQALDGVTEKLVVLFQWVARVIEKNKEWVTGIALWTAAIFTGGAALMAFGLIVQLTAFAVGGLATALVAVSAIVSVVLAPLALSVIALAALVYYSGLAGDALEWLGEKFASLKELVSETLKGMADALAAGDIRLASQILWATMKMEWLKGTQALHETWMGWVGQFGDLWGEAIASWRSVFVVAAYAIGDVWNTIVDRIVDKWMQIQAVIAMALKMAAAHYGLGKAGREVLRDYAQRSRKRREDRATRDEGSGRRRDAELQIIEEDRLNQKRERDRKRNKATLDRRLQLAATEEERAALIAAAAAAAAAGAEDGQDKDSKDRARDASSGGGVKQLADTARGTFSADVLGRLGRGTERVQEKIEENTRDAATLLKQIDTNLQNNALSVIA